MFNYIDGVILKQAQELGEYIRQNHRFIKRYAKATNRSPQSISELIEVGAYVIDGEIYRKSKGRKK